MGIESVGRGGPVSPPPSESHRERERLRQVVQDFEALFLSYLLKTMRQALGKSGFLDGGLAQEVYEGLFDYEVARTLAKAGGIGLGPILERQLQQSLPSGEPGQFPSRTPRIRR